MFNRILKAGSHLLDATVIPADIEYPADAKLLNRARQWLVDGIKRISKKFNLKNVRTYCKVAQLLYISYQKKRRKTKKVIRLMRGKLLRFVRRNMRQLEELLPGYGEKLTVTELEKLYRRLRVITTLYAQQLEMWKRKARSIGSRIVSLHLPHIRPMVRGKDGRERGIRAEGAVKLGGRIRVYGQA